MVGQHRSELNVVKKETLDSWDATHLPEEELSVPPEQGVDRIARLIADRTKKDYDAMILATGPTGSGKSTLVMRIAEAVAAHLKRPEWDPSEHVLYTPSDVYRFYLKALQTGQHGEIGIYDEGARGLLSLDTMSPQTRRLVRMLQMVRKIRCVLFVCVPSMMAISKSFRVRLAHMWVAVERRGMARVHLRDNTIQYSNETTFGFSVWSECPNVKWSPYPPNSRVWRHYKEGAQSELLSDLKESARWARVGAAGAKPDRHKRWYRKHRAEYNRKRRARAAKSRGGSTTQPSHARGETHGGQPRVTSADRPRRAAPRVRRRTTVRQNGRSG